MENRIDILKELRALSPVIAGMEKVNVFAVPEGYFASLSADILASLKEEDNSLINSFSTQKAAQVPPGYFDTLADTVLAKIKAQQNETAAEELRILSPMLYSIQNENVFEVPAGYFASLADTLVDKVRPQQTKVVEMYRRRTSFMKYAVAAAFTGIMLLGVVKYTGHSSEVVAQVLPEYVTNGLKPHNVDAELSKVSDADIIKYLQSNGSDVNAALVANSVDENDLPSQDDYLTDDKALDKYLNSINVNDQKN